MPEKLKRGRPSLFNDKYYEDMSMMFGNDKRKIQNAHYWATASSLLDKHKNEIKGYEYLADGKKVFRQCALTELGRLYDLMTKYYDTLITEQIWVTVTNNICCFASENNLTTRELEKNIRLYRLSIIRDIKKKNQ